MYHPNPAPNAASKNDDFNETSSGPDAVPMDDEPPFSLIYSRGEAVASGLHHSGQTHPESFERVPQAGLASHQSSNAIRNLPTHVGPGFERVVEGQIAASNVTPELDERYLGYYRADNTLYAWQGRREDDFQGYGMPPGTSLAAENKVQKFSTKSFTLNEALRSSAAVPASTSTPQLDLGSVEQVEAAKQEGGGEYEWEDTKSERDSQPPEAPAESSSSVVRSASGQKMHQCQVCGKSFPRPGALTTHMHGHSGLRPFRCPVPGCERTFSVRSNAKRHLKTHGMISMPKTVDSSTRYEVQFDDPVVAETHAGTAPTTYTWVSEES